MYHHPRIISAGSLVAFWLAAAPGCVGTDGLEFAIPDAAQLAPDAHAVVDARRPDAHTPDDASELDHDEGIDTASPDKDAATPDGPPPPPQIALSSDFEDSTSIGDNRRGYVMLTTEKFVTGSHAIKVVANPDDGQRAKQTNFIFSSPLSSHFGRIYVHVSQSMEMGRLIEMYFAPGGSLRTIFAVRDGRASLGFEGGSTGMRAAPFPANRWVCVEWHYDSVGAEYWIDGSATPSLEQLTSAAVPPATKLTLGLITGSSMTVYYDALVISDQRIGCLSPQP